MATYKRESLLPRVLRSYQSQSLPSLSAIILVWQDTTTKPPNWLSDHNSTDLPLFVRQSAVNSMNERFRLDEHVQTEAVFMVDDDLFLQPKVIEHAFQVWKQIGRDQRIVGFSGRDFQPVTPQTHGQQYRFDVLPRKTYSMVLSNAAFFHRSFLEMYWQDKYAGYRAHVDSVFNCDDLLINFLVSNHTGLPPVLIQPRTPLVTYPKSGGLVTRDDHWPKRSACVNQFASMMGRMPLVKSSWSISEDVVDRARYAESEHELEDEDEDDWSTMP